MPSPGATAATLIFSHNDVYNPGGSAAYGGTCAGTGGTNGNISVDPIFTSVGTVGGFHLAENSPAVDTGNNLAAGVGPTDLAGAPRIQNAKGLPTAIIDMGAYEHAGIPATAPSPDFTLAATPDVVDLSQTTSATVQLLVTPNSSLQGPLTFTCANVPVGVQCAFVQ